jgi:hypothetical protein
MGMVVESDWVKGMEALMTDYRTKAAATPVAAK